jgi:hypothetical protein
MMTPELPTITPAPDGVTVTDVRFAAVPLVTLLHVTPP